MAKQSAKNLPVKRTSKKKPPPLCETHEQTASKTNQVLNPAGANTFTIRHRHVEAVQYDFYLPVKIYFHAATQRFIAGIAVLSPGSTLFRGATGIWKSDAEDTYIHRFIIEPNEYTRDNLRRMI